MKLSDILTVRSVLPALEAKSADEAIRALARALPLKWSCQDEVELSAFARERAGSTGVGGGVALPHGSCGHLSEPRLAFARLAGPLDFGASDGRPIRLLFLLAVPREGFYCHLFPLATLSQLGGGGALPRALLAAGTREELFRILAEVPL